MVDVDGPRLLTHLGIDRKMIAELSTLRFVEDRRNLMVLGPPEVGGSPIWPSRSASLPPRPGYRTYLTADARERWRTPGVDQLRPEGGIAAPQPCPVLLALVARSSPLKTAKDL